LHVVPLRAKQGRGRSGRAGSETAKAARYFCGGLYQKKKKMAARFRRATTKLLIARNESSVED